MTTRLFARLSVGIRAPTGRCRGVGQHRRSERDTGFAARAGTSPWHTLQSPGTQTAPQGGDSRGTTQRQRHASRANPGARDSAAGHHYPRPNSPRRWASSRPTCIACYPDSSKKATSKSKAAAGTQQPDRPEPPHAKDANHRRFVATARACAPRRGCVAVPAGAVRSPPGTGVWRRMRETESLPVLHGIWPP
jgi:hypothetical protein